MEEVWKEIEEFKGHYEVSNLGRVRSVDRYVGKRLYPSKIIKNCVNSKDNTVLVRLYISRVAYVRSVAKLVVQTFLGSPCKRIQCFSTTAQAVKHIFFMVKSVYLLESWNI